MLNRGKKLSRFRCLESFEDSKIKCNVYALPAYAYPCPRKIGRLPMHSVNTLITLCILDVINKEFLLHFTLIT